MTEISQAELDARMGRYIDPNSIPKHDGGDHGVMEGVIQKGTADTQRVHVGAGRDGAAVFLEGELGDPFHFGSKTVISINEAPPLPEKFEPKVAGQQPVRMPPIKQAPVMAASLASVLARARSGSATNVVPLATAPAPVQIQPTPAPSVNAAQVDMLKRLGLVGKKP